MKTYPAKLLLFGEYGLMFGAKALAVPFPRFSGHFAKVECTRMQPSQQASAAELARFAAWFVGERVAQNMHFPLRSDELKADLEGGLYYESDVPLQYGVGSSGSLCAALYDTYSTAVLPEFPDPEFILKVKADFVWLESYFHGRSSGLDPLVSYLNRPVLVEGDRISLPALRLGEQPWCVCLFDTEMTSPTAPLVAIFLAKMEQPRYSALFRERYLPANDAAVEAFMQNNQTRFFEALEKVHHFQMEHFTEMIPDSCLPELEELARTGALFKLLGSGGGGYLLVFSPAENELSGTKKSFRVF